MENYKQLPLWEEYIPKVNDYVIWDKYEFGSDEGWVYFFCDEYITIETSVKPKPKDEYAKNDRHKMIHTLLLCPNHHWHSLQYVRSRTSHEQIEHYSQCED
jgi:hypothetical protein